MYSYRFPIKEISQIYLIQWIILLPLVDVNVVTLGIRLVVVVLEVVVLVVVAIILVFSSIISGVDVVVFDTTVKMEVSLKCKVIR